MQGEEACLIDNDPLAPIETFANANNLLFERSESEITLVMSGQKSDYQVSFTWMPDTNVLHMACGFEFKPPPHRHEEVKELVILVNEVLWVGHFDMWFKDGLVLFRNGMPFPDSGPTALQCQVLCEEAFQTCEQFYPAFQYVIWAGKTAAEAMEAAQALMSVQGEA